MLFPGSDPGKRPGDPRVDAVAFGNALLLRSGIGTDALVECGSAILEITGIHGALGGGWEKDCFHSKPGDIQRRRPAWRSRNIDVNTRQEPGRRVLLGGSPLFYSGP